MISCVVCKEQYITKNGKILEPQEFKVKADLNGMDPYNVLAATTFALINGVDINLMNN